MHDVFTCHPYGTSEVGKAKIIRYYQGNDVRGVVKRWRIIYHMSILISETQRLSQSQTTVIC